MKTNKQIDGRIGIAIAVLAVIIVGVLIMFDVNHESGGSGQYPKGVVVPTPQQVGQYQAAHPLPGPGVPSLVMQHLGRLPSPPHHG